MKEGRGRIALILLPAALIGSCLRVSPEVFEARVTGVVIDATTRRPVAGATVKRISEKDKVEFGVIKTIRFYSDEVVTDVNGRFVLPEQKRIRWWRWPLEYALPWIHCYAFIEVSAPARLSYVSDFGDRDLTVRGNPNWACNGVSMYKVVSLSPVQP